MRIQLHNVKNPWRLKVLLSFHAKKINIYKCQNVGTYHTMGFLRRLQRNKNTLFIFFNYYDFLSTLPPHHHHIQRTENSS